MVSGPCNQSLLPKAILIDVMCRLGVQRVVWRSANTQYGVNDMTGSAKCSFLLSYIHRFLGFTAKQDLNNIKLLSASSTKIML